MLELKAFHSSRNSAGECLICGAPLEYLVRDEPMECALCGRKEPSKTRCAAGHYVCSGCHSRGVGAVLPLCLSST